jgi:hypothetical protein
MTDKQNTYLNVENLEKKERLVLYKKLKKTRGIYGRIKLEKLVSVFSYASNRHILKSRKVLKLKNKWFFGVMYVFRRSRGSFPDLQTRIQNAKKDLYPILGDKLQVRYVMARGEEIVVALYKT